MTNYLNVKNIEDIIDDAIRRHKTICFVCDGIIAEFIEDYVYEKHELDDITSELDGHDEEYYVSIFGNPSQLIVESAFGISGKYKSGEDVPCVYYVLTDMPDDEMARCFKNQMFIRCEFVDIEDECMSEDDIIEDLMDFVFNTDACICCKVSRIIDTLYEFKDRGASEK